MDGKIKTFRKELIDDTTTDESTDDSFEIEP